MPAVPSEEVSRPRGTREGAPRAGRVTAAGGAEQDPVAPTEPVEADRPDANGTASLQVPAPERQRDAERTRAEILDAATAEFAVRGYTGGRVDEIAARTRTTKRMIYYYFGNKEGLYVAVLERAYGTIRSLEQGIDVEGLDPVRAMRALAELTFDHHESHPDFIRLVGIENIHHAEHLRKSPALSGLGGAAVDVLEGILARGRSVGLFRSDVDALDVHMVISAFCVFRIANRHTFQAIFGRDMLDERLRAHHRAMLGDLVLEYLTAHVARG